MSEHVKRIECCYCAASSLVNLKNPHAMTLICSGCGAKMSVDRMSALAIPSPASVPAPAPIRREVVFERPVERKGSDDKRRGGSGGSGKRRRRRSFLKRIEDIWDEIEDIFD